MTSSASSGPLSHDDVALLSGQIAGLASAGLPLASGLRATADEMPRGRLGATLVAIAKALESGDSVEDAIASQGDRLPGHLRGLVLAGSRTGKLSEVLGRFAAFVNVGAELRRRVWLSLAYPILSLFLAFGISAFICASLVMTFETIFKDFGVPLPKITILLIEVAHLFQHGWALVPELIGLFLVLWIGSHLVLRAPLRKSLIGSVPVVGGVWRNTSLAEFCHLLALLLESDVPLDLALRMTGDGVLDASIDHACGAMTADVRGGLTLSQAISRRPIFPRGLAQILRWAEKHQGLADSLHMAGELFEARARAQASFAGTVLSVIALIAILLGAALVVMGLFLPLISLISRLSG